MNEEKQELKDCPLCHEKHEPMMLFGMEFIPVSRDAGKHDNA